MTRLLQLMEQAFLKDAFFHSFSKHILNKFYDFLRNKLNNKTIIIYE